MVLLRILLFFVLATAGGAGGMAIVLKVFGYTPHELWHPLDFVLSEGVQLLGVVAATLALARIERRRAGEYGLPLARSAPRRLAAGFAWGLAFVSALVAALAAARAVSYGGLAAPAAPALGSALLWLLAMLLLGLFEEAGFRGYPLVALAGRIGFWPASAVLSIGFGALHYFTKPHETWLDALNVSLIALFLCLAIRRTGDLWWAAGFHAAFDFAALIVFASPNSGNDGKSVAGHVLDASFHGPAWLTGGACGIEASVLVLPLLGALSLLFERTHRRAPTSAPVPPRTGS
jgi:membrane protease YdiL (CAAX protease family)